MGIVKGVCGNCSKEYLEPFFARCRHNSVLSFCPPCGRAEAIAMSHISKAPDSFGYRGMFESLMVDIMDEEWFEEEREEYEEFMRTRILRELVRSQGELEEINTDSLYPEEMPWSWAKNGAK